MMSENLDSASDADSNVGEAEGAAILDIDEADDALERAEPAKPSADKEPEFEAAPAVDVESAADATDHGGEETSDDGEEDVEDEVLPAGAAVAVAMPAEEDDTTSEEDIPMAEPVVVPQTKD